MEIRVLRTAKVTLSRVFYVDELPTAATGGVTVTVARLDGTTVQTGPATLGGDGATYTFTFDGRDVLDVLTVSWAATVAGDAVILDQDVIEVVGGFYFGLAEARDIDPVLSNTTNFPTSSLIARRIETEAEAEEICGQAFVPRFAREVHAGGERTIRLKWPLLRKIRAITVDGTAYSQSAIDAIGGPDDLGLVRYSTSGAPWPTGVGNIVIEYEHGMDRPPVTVVRGAKLRMKSLLLQNKSPVPDRTERIASTEMGVVFLATEKRDSTGIASVDACYFKYLSPRPGFG